MSFSPLCCHTAEVCQGKHTRREKGSHREPTGHHGGPWVTLGDHDQGLRGQTLSTKGLQQCSIDQGHGPLSGRSSGFQSQRVTPVWAAQWPPGSGSQGDHPSGAHSERVTRRPVQMSSHILRKLGFTRLIASKLRNFAIRLADMRESFGLPIHYIGLCSKR